MAFLNRLFSGRSLKFLLMAAWFVLMACAIGYLGPYIGFGEARPFAPAGARLLFILLALQWLVAIWYGVALCLPGALTLCAAVWVAGPYVLIGEHYPLHSTAVRLAIIAVVMTLILLYAAWRLLLFTLNNPAWTEKIRFRRTASVPDPAITALLVCLTINTRCLSCMTTPCKPAIRQRYLMPPDGSRWNPRPGLRRLKILSRRY